MNRRSVISSCAFLVSMAGVVTLAHGQARPPAVRGPRSPAGAAPVTPASATPGAAGSYPTAVPPAPPPAAPFRPTTDATSAPTTTEAATQFRAPGGGVTIGLQEADLPDLVNWIGGLTGKRFIYGSKLRSLKVTLYSPTPVTVAEAYRAFLVALETNGLTVVPHGRFLKIIETAGVANETTPIYGTAQPVPAEDRYVTRLYRLQHVGADEVATVLTKFKSKEGDVSAYGGGNLLILTDTGSNIRRMLQLVEEIDVGASGEQIWVEPVHYVQPSELAQRLNDLFDIKGGAAPAAPPRGGNQTAAVGSGGGGAGSTDVRVTKIVPDDRAKSLVIIASERAYLRMLEVIKRIDVPPTTGEGDIHVMPLQHAMAEELAPVLNQILGGAGGAIPGAPGQNRPPGSPAPAPAPGVSGAGGQVPLGIFEGVVRITADKSTNSVIVTSSLRDYAQVRNVIDKLDQPRRQVFIEAVVMDVSVSDTDRLSVSYHGGAAPTFEGLTGQQGNGIVYGGLNPTNTIFLPPPPSELNGLALGVRGPTLPNSTNLLGTGISVPAFGVLLNALATNSNANVLATPHIIATDNTPAEISVGENIPLQTNVGGISQLAGAAGAQGAGALGALGGLGGLGALGGFGAAPRTDVGTKIKVTPHMNDSNEVRLELQEEISERGDSPTGSLGAVSIRKRTANTSVVVKDQQTVVIGGLVRDYYSTAVQKVPLLGDIPVLGVLFRRTENTKAKSNLLLILTPYVIRDQQDLRAVFERKMQERQEFLDRYFVFSDQRPYEVPKDFARLNGLLEDIRQSNLKNDERRRLSDASKPRERKVHEPTTPIEMPDIVRPSSGGAGGTTVQAPAGGQPAGGGRRGGGSEGGATVPAGGQNPAPRGGPAVLTPGTRGAPAPRRE